MIFIYFIVFLTKWTFYDTIIVHMGVINMIGYYEVRIDEKNRIFLPSKFRKTIGQNVVITSLLTKKYEIRSLKEFDKLINETNDKDKLIFYKNNSFEVKLDSNGRIILPNNIFSSNELVVSACDEVLEVLDKERYIKESLERYERFTKQEQIRTLK